MNSGSSLRIDWESATVTVNGVSVLLKSVLLTPVLVNLLAKISVSGDDKGVFNRDLFQVLSPKIVTELTGVPFDNELTLLPQLGNPEFTQRVELVKRWIADKEARKAQFEAARYMHLCVSRHLRRSLPFVLSGFLIHQNASLCASAYFTEIYNNFNLSETNKTYLLALLSRMLLINYNRQVSGTDEVGIGKKQLGRYFSEEIDNDPEFLTLFKLYKFLKMYEVEFSKTKVVEPRDYLSSKEVVIGRKDIFKMFLDWLESIDPYSVAVGIFDPKYTKNDSIFPKFFSELLLRVLAGRDDVKANTKRLGLKLYDKKKKLKV